MEYAREVRSLERDDAPLLDLRDTTTKMDCIEVERRRSGVEHIIGIILSCINPCLEISDRAECREERKCLVSPVSDDP